MQVYHVLPRRVLETQDYIHKQRENTITVIIGHEIVKVICENTAPHITYANHAVCVFLTSLICKQILLVLLIIMSL